MTHGALRKTGLTRRDLLKASLAAPMAASACVDSACVDQADGTTLQGPPITPDPEFPVDGPPLRVLAEAKGRRFGTAAVWSGYLQTDPRLREVYRREAGVIVPDTELKWSWTRPSAATANWWGTDQLLLFCENANIAFHGHNLAWEEDNPAWTRSVITSANAEPFLRQHVRAVMTRYGSRMISCDVVNEPIWLGHDKPGGLRNGIWLETLGEAYIDIAFDEAHRIAPNVLLVLNEAAIETTIPEDQKRREAFLKLLDRLKQRNVPVQSIGIESHLSTISAVDDGDFTGFLKELGSRRLPVQISELDMSDSHETGSIAERDRKVAEAYYRYLTIALRDPGVQSVKTWELWDGRTKPKGDPDKFPRPMPFDINLKRKPAWGAIARAFREAPTRA